MGLRGTSVIMGISVGMSRFSITISINECGVI